MAVTDWLDGYRAGCVRVRSVGQEFDVAAPRLDPRQVWHARGMPPGPTPLGLT